MNYLSHNVKLHLIQNCVMLLLTTTYAGGIMAENLSPTAKVLNAPSPPIQTQLPVDKLPLLRIRWNSYKSLSHW
jgi:hypothetical protein